MRAALVGAAATLLGAIIGGVGVYAGVQFASKLDGVKDRAKSFHTYQGWLYGLQAELRHVQKVIRELRTNNLREGIATTKRLNSDFIEESRLKIFEYDKDVRFLEILTNAYRDIVHTNGMLDRLEKWQMELKKGSNSKFNSKRFNFQYSLRNTKDSFQGVRVSIVKLRHQIRVKLKKTLIGNHFTDPAFRFGFLLAMPTANAFSSP